ncbi:hypothetical protein [Pseudochryseolinea flava]|uniref:Uncharacterized protein n=1 Tax=Pseudochryseolinea flava TaxID=2059302 RepID=A0A364Y2V6_9BACT|nr:hypothetical protein [Pseudochryseolinea flava]RAW01110.1 hypothetical protein DQQ10_12845 [Pseudochryseolinea flava]
MINNSLIVNLICLMMTMFCCQNSEKILVTGVAIDCKAGAGVLTVPDSSLYYVDGIDYWEDNVLGRRIRVEGKLLLRNFPARKDGVAVQSIVGDSVRFILDPRWELVR